VLYLDGGDEKGIFMHPEAQTAILLGMGSTVFLLVSLAAYVGYLRRVAPPPSTDDPLIYRGRTPDALFARMDVRVKGQFFLLMMVSGALGYMVLLVIARIRIELLPATVLSYSMSHAYFALNAAGLGLGVAGTANGPVLRWRLPAEARWYFGYMSVRRYGCDYERLCRGVGRVVVVLALVAFVPGANCYVQARSNVFVVKRLLSWRSETHAYTDIRSIRTAREVVEPNGGLRHGRDFVVLFRDGRQWMASELPSGSLHDRIVVAQYLCRRSGVPIIEMKQISMHGANQ
jgi:hypothetical protein